MLRPLSFITVREVKHEAAEPVPFVFAGRNKLIDNDLRCIQEVAELRFPNNEGIGVIEAITEFKAKHPRLAERAIIDLEAAGPLGCQAERREGLARLHVK